MVLPALLAFLVTVVITPVIIAGLRRWRLMDVPNERSSHAQPTPRGGGLAVAAGVLVATAVAADLPRAARIAILVAGVAFALVGLLEDVVGVPALRRVPLLALAACAPLPWLLAGVVGPPLWRAVFTVGVMLWLLSYANAYNFMDGINGLAAGQAVVAGLAWYAIGGVEGADAFAAMGLIAIAAALGFAPYNALRARVFLGDVGSYFLGAVLATTAVIGLRSGIPPEAVFAPLSLFLADTAITLVRRVARGDRWYEPHREHVYQRLTGAFGGSHPRALLIVVTLMAACAGLGSLSLSGSPPVRVLGDAAILGVMVAYFRTPRLVARVRDGQRVFA